MAVWAALGAEHAAQGRAGMKVEVFRSLRMLMATVLLMNVGTAFAQFVLSDDRSGMTCADYVGGDSLAWQRQGGDWMDAQGAIYGEVPFARQIVPRTRETQGVVWNVTELVRTWQQDASIQGGVFLRQLGSPDASVVFHSREAEERTLHPVLNIEWDDATNQTLSPIADATMDCSSASGKGTKSTLQVGGRRSVILIFPFARRTGAQVLSANLRMFSERQHRASSDIGVFRLHVPFADVADKRTGIAAGYEFDEGLREHPSVIFSSGFESRSWLDEWSSMGRSSNAELISRSGSNGFEPWFGSALAVTVDKGKKMGLNLLYRFQEKTGSEPEEAYFRYYLRLGSNWTPRAGGKLPGFAGTYNRAGWGGRMSDGINGWSARGRFEGASANRPGRSLIGSYVYHADMIKKYGSGWGWNLGPTGLLENNRWYSIEQYVKLNRPGAADGVLRAWIDGVLVFEKADLRFRKTPELGIETLWMNVYHGGTARAPHDITLYIDNVVIASEYIGPVGGGGDVARR